jgi:hypothetical protein
MKGCVWVRTRHVSERAPFVDQQRRERVPKVVGAADDYVGCINRRTEESVAPVIQSNSPKPASLFGKT